MNPVVLAGSPSGIPVYTGSTSGIPVAFQCTLLDHPVYIGSGQGITLHVYVIPDIRPNKWSRIVSEFQKYKFFNKERQYELRQWLGAWWHQTTAP